MIFDFAQVMQAFFAGGAVAFLICIAVQGGENRQCADYINKLLQDNDFYQDERWKHEKMTYRKEE